jgi:hypothetical protein
LKMKEFKQHFLEELGKFTKGMFKGIFHLLGLVMCQVLTMIIQFVLEKQTTLG